MAKKKCVFCDIVAGKEKAYVVYEDEDVLAFLHKNAYSEGHTVIIPKRHYETIYDLPAELFCKIVDVAQKLATFYKKELKCESVNILHASGKLAGQSVMHFHLHLVPRYKNDQLGSLWYAPKDRCINNLLIYGRLTTSKYYKSLGSKTKLNFQTA